MKRIKQAAKPGTRARDTMQQMGALPLASRLRRLHERLLRDGARIYREQKLPFEPRWFPVYTVLLRHSPMSVTEMAREIGLTHPAINQVANAMEKAGLLVSVRDRRDDRKRLLSLSAKGKRLESHLKPLWESFAQATTELMKEIGVDLIGVMDLMEHALDKKEMYERIATCRKRRQLEGVEIADYEPRLAKYFKSLNQEWLQKYFEIEPADKKILSDPEGSIIDRGGQVLFASVNGKIVGTVALMRISDTVFELAKLAVTHRAQGQQIGKKLVLAVIERAHALGAKELFLHTHPKQVAACSLYRALGFKVESTALVHETGHKRQSVIMRLNLARASG